MASGGRWLAEFTDPRLVAIYESANPYRPGTQPDFYVGLAAEVGARSIVDLGCGTGLITRELARLGHRVVGVDPNAAMLAVARTRPHGDRVRWIHGDATALEPDRADLAIMSGHVAQFFLTAESWQRVLTSLRAALRPGGHLAFESRNPDAREWETWTADDLTTLDDPTAGRIEMWTTVDDFDHGVASCTNYYRFAQTGEVLTSSVRLRFRSEDDVIASLATAGFAVERMFGDWDRRPVGRAAPELIVVAVSSPPHG